MAFLWKLNLDQYVLSIHIHILSTVSFPQKIVLVKYIECPVDDTSNIHHFSQICWMMYVLNNPMNFYLHISSSLSRLYICIEIYVYLCSIFSIILWFSCPLLFCLQHSALLMVKGTLEIILLLFFVFKTYFRLLDLED